MAIKIISFLFALLAALWLVQTVSCLEESDRYGDQFDLLFIENSDTNPTVISPMQALLGSHGGHNVCYPKICQRVCRSLNFRYGHCYRNRVCVCSNS